MGGFHRPGRGGEVSTSWWLSTGYQAGVGGGGVGVQPPGIFKLCRVQFLVCTALSSCVYDPQPFVLLCKSPQPRSPKTAAYLFMKRRLNV